MRLKKLKLENFRGYAKETVVDFTDELTAFLGRNDAGKSTILEALEIFFNNETIKIDIGDLSKSAISNMISLTCIFDELPGQVVVDANYPTTLQDEFLTNTDGDLEIRKEYKVQATVGKPSVFVIANHPINENISDLHRLKISQLKTLGKQLGVEGDVQDQRVASLWRKAIWAHESNLELKIQKIAVSDLGTDSKEVFARVEALFPTFALFRSDRASNDVDPEARNPLQAAVKQAQKDLQDEINEIQAKIERSVIDVADRTLDKIREMDPNLANELTPRFKEPPKWTFNFTLDSDDGVPMNKRGSGARRLILLNFFRAEAEKRKTDNHSPRVIYAIEEPETSQHPNYQVMLVEALLRLSVREDCQILLTTHVPALAGLLPTDSIRFVSKDESGIPSVEPGDEDTLLKAASSLGVLPEAGVAGAKAVLLVEGHSDVTFVNHSAQVLYEKGYLPRTLADCGIAVIPIGGCGNLKHWVTKQLIEQLGLNWSVLLDSDFGDSIEHPRNLKKIEEIRELGKIALLTKKREPENYIAPSVVKDRYGVVLTYTESCDAKKIIASATRTRPEDVLEKLWPLMSAQDIVEMSKYQSDGSERVEIVEMLKAILDAHTDINEVITAVLVCETT
jgi:predicted ATP-dependent endonuclease of OLD family